MGWPWTALLNGGLGLSAYLIARSGLRQAPGWPRILATIVLGWAWLTIGMQLLGSFGLLAREPLLGWVGAGLLVGLGCAVVRRGKTPSTKADRSADGSVSWEEIVSYGLVLWASTIFGLTSLLYPVKVVSDGPIYHLYQAIRWWKAGRLEWIATPFGEIGATYFPANGDLWFSWLVVGWGGDRLAKVGQVPFYVVIGLTVMALARRLGAGRRASAVATSWVLLTSPLFFITFEANVDTIFMAGYLLASYFFLRFSMGDDGRNGLVLGALAAGCALGTKAPAFVFVVPLLMLALWSALARGQDRRGKVLNALIVLLVPLSVAGFWYGKNLILTGNPLYPLHLAGLGVVWLRGWYGPGAMSASEYYLPIGDWRAFIDILLVMFDPRMIPLWLAAVAGTWAWKSPTKGPIDRWVWMASGLAVVNVLLYWVLIPYRTQQRFMLHAVGLAAIPLARLFDRNIWIRRVGVALLAVHVFTRHGWLLTDGIPPWDLSPQVPSILEGLIPFPVIDSSNLFRLERSGLYFLTGLISIAIAWLVMRAIVRPTWRRWAGSMTSVILLGSFLFLMSYPWNINPRLSFYPGFPDYIQGWMALESRSGPTGSRVAYAGTNLPYYLFGVNLRNEVRYVNLDDHPDWLMHDYHLAVIQNGSEPATWPNPHPSWDRSHGDYSSWLANLRRDRIQLLVVTQANAKLVSADPAGVSYFPIEGRWADEHPESFELLYGGFPNDPKFRLYRVKPAAGP
ncbi:glycosyltransferase family 39 protein [Tundrisphaera lichenicola]|uniref:glycosyltransferase family 39 protein n=1 Tax=Tundrisphaera lichenicola TaxID=2029860 RepID=UPI003EB80B52